MLASAVGRVKDRQIYATGGNDNSVGIWDLTEFFLAQEELPPISNGNAIHVSLARDTLLIVYIQMKWSTVLPNSSLSRPSLRAQSSQENAIKVLHSSVGTATISVLRQSC
jgi:hypothetical protein